MNIELSSDEIIKAIHIYMAIKGYKGDRLLLRTIGGRSDVYAVYEGAKKASADMEKVIRYARA